MRMRMRMHEAVAGSNCRIRCCRRPAASCPACRSPCIPHCCPPTSYHQTTPTSLQIERFVFRPGLSERARYYAAVTLNQLALSARPEHGGAGLAKRLVEIYFKLFALILEGKLGQAAALKRDIDERKEQQRGYHHGGGGKKGSGGKQSGKQSGGKKGSGGGKAAAAAGPQAGMGELDARMLSALITGVRRAFPYVEQSEVEPLVEAHGEALFRLVHTAPFTVGLQALMLLFQLLAGRGAASDRFYRALYAALLAEGARAGGKAPQFLALLFKAMKADPSAKRCAAFAKRLLQVCAVAPPSWAAGALLLLSEVLKAQPALWAGVQQPEDGGDDEERFVDVDASSDDDAEDGGKEDGDGERAARAQKDAARRQRQQQQKGGGGGGDGELPPWPRPGAYDMRKR